MLPNAVSRIYARTELPKQCAWFRYVKTNIECLPIPCGQFAARKPKLIDSTS
jgi:hypothetical protein